MTALLHTEAAAARNTPLRRVRLVQARVPQKAEREQPGPFMTSAKQFSVLTQCSRRSIVGHHRRRPRHHHLHTSQSQPQTPAQARARPRPPRQPNESRRRFGSRRLPRSPPAPIPRPSASCRPKKRRKSRNKQRVAHQLQLRLVTWLAISNNCDPCWTRANYLRSPLSRTRPSC